MVDENSEDESSTVDQHKSQELKDRLLKLQ